MPIGSVPLRTQKNNISVIFNPPIPNGSNRWANSATWEPMGPAVGEASDKLTGYPCYHHWYLAEGSIQVPYYLVYHLIRGLLREKGRRGYRVIIACKEFGRFKTLSIAAAGGGGAGGNGT